MKRLPPFLILTAILSGSAPAPAPPPPQWPAAPAEARLRYVGEIAGPRVAAAGRLGSFLRALVGLDKAGEISEDRLIRPTGICVSSGTVFIADPGRRAVLRYEEATGKGEWWPHSTRQRLLAPVSVAQTPDGRLLVVDSILKKVFILDAAGKIMKELDGDPRGLGQPASVAASDERIYVSDVKNHRIAVYGMEGVFLHSFGRRGTETGELNFPTYLWFDKASRRLWVSDSGNFRVQWFDANGKPLGRLGENGNRPGYLARPRGIATDSDGHAYISDAAFDAFQIFDEKMSLLLFVGRAGGAVGEFNMPGGISIDARDRVYVADTQNGRVQVFQYLKEVTP